MLTRPTQFLCGAVAMLCALSVSQGQVTPPAPAPLSSPMATVQPAAPVAETPQKPAAPVLGSKTGDNSMLLVQANAATTPPAPGTPGTATTTTATTTATGEPEPITDNGGVGVREFQGDEVGQVLRLLARQ